MSPDAEGATSRPNGIVDPAPANGRERDRNDDRIPTTPSEVTETLAPPPLNRMPSSQQSIASTQDPASPADPSASFRIDVNNDRTSSSHVIPSSVTPPPPSSQPTQPNALGGSFLSPPVTTMRNTTKETKASPSTSRLDSISHGPDAIDDASAEELRTMVQAYFAENAKLRMENAHHKFQYNLLSMQAEEDAKRAAVEHEMTRREVDVLRATEQVRQARRELNSTPDTTMMKYRELQALYDAAVKDIDILRRRQRSSTKMIQQQAEALEDLQDERDMLLNRIRENREHFHMLCSPGGAFHGALTPKISTVATPQQPRATPRQTPRSTNQHHFHLENDPNQAGFAALLQAVDHENNSAPSTPITANRPPPRLPPKHTRGVQSLSSLPTTPISRGPRDRLGLLPSADLVPHTEPQARYSNARYAPETPRQGRGRKSRESTISADDNEELARAALESVAAATQSYMSQGSRASQRQQGGEEEIYESQASQAASEMLRRDPRESFEVASSVGSRDGTPAPAEKTAKLQSKLFANLNKSVPAPEKRKFNGESGGSQDSRREAYASPSKRARYDGNGDRIGLGIKY
ncbi:hypothetical protein F4780DRAFT_753335 [Xylariomycetidae sp. FL0641]|nr:hypothetical protein F4780DRAFT_753335 [Xylariomycetidae sp. FL0641]